MAKKKKIERDAAAISAKLDAIEAEMKRIGFWSPDSARPAQGGYLDMEFKLWLQFVFLPSARAATEARSWPEKSQVGVMAMRNYDYMSVVEEAHGLMRLCYEFDDLIEHPEKGVSKE